MSEGLSRQERFIPPLELRFPDLVLRYIDDYYFEHHYEDLAAKVNNFLEHFPYVEQQGYAEAFMKLVQILLFLENSPKNRELGQEKAEFCAGLLMSGGVSARVEEFLIENNQTLYNVVARAGVSERDKNEDTITGLLSVHHDNISHDRSLIGAEGNDEEICYPWLLDDTVHLAAAMMEMILFQQEYIEAENRGEIAPDSDFNLSLVVLVRSYLDRFAIMLYLSLTILPIHFSRRFDFWL